VRTLVKRVGKRSQRDFTLINYRVLKNGDVLVRSRLDTPGQEPLTLDWRVHKCKSGPCISDLIVAGASVSLQRRDRVAERMARPGGSIAKIIDDLRKNPSRV
jgi:ABC-type transporter MlaC component